jgi:hypothetical protein
MKGSKSDNVSRISIEKALTTAIITALDDLHLPQDARHLCRVFRALVGLGLDCMAAGADGAVPVEVVTDQLNRVLARRLPKPTPKTAPGTLGSCVQRGAKA